VLKHSTSKIKLEK